MPASTWRREKSCLCWVPKINTKSKFRLATSVQIEMHAGKCSPQHYPSEMPFFPQDKSSPFIIQFIWFQQRVPQLWISLPMSLFRCFWIQPNGRLLFLTKISGFCSGFAQIKPSLFLNEQHHYLMPQVTLPCPQFLLSGLEKKGEGNCHYYPL